VSELSDLGLLESLAAGPAILFFDIETTPILGWTWGMYKQNVLGVVKDSEVLCFAYRWRGQKRKQWVGQNVDEVTLDADGVDIETPELYVVKRLRALLDAADIVVAHNGDRFDVKKTNTRMLKHGLSQPSPYQKVDTLKLARQNFDHGSNRLDNLARYHGSTRKVHHNGMPLWFGCMEGDESSWRLMKRYNLGDIDPLVDMYEKFVPWVAPGQAGVPNMAHFGPEGANICPRCGRQDTLIKRGFTYRTGVSTFQSLQCSKARGGCGGYARGRQRKPQLDGGVWAV